MLLITILLLIKLVVSLKPNFVNNLRKSSNIELSSNEINKSKSNLDYLNKKSKSSITSGGSKTKAIRPQGKGRSEGLINPNKLKIIAGKVKGMKIESPDVYLRPMMAKVREALFSTLEFMELFSSGNTMVLDIFSGSGSVGLEALSRGATRTTFVDMSPNCIDVSLKNGAKLGFGANVKGICAKAEEVLLYPEKFNLNETFQLITLTPPYEEVDYDELLNCVSSSKLLEENSIVVIEYPVEMGTLPYVINNKLFGLRNRKYGRTIIAIYVYMPSKSFDMHPQEFIPTSSK